MSSSDIMECLEPNVIRLHPGYSLHEEMFVHSGVWKLEFARNFWISEDSIS